MTTRVSSLMQMFEPPTPKSAAAYSKEMAAAAAIPTLVPNKPHTPPTPPESAVVHHDVNFSWAPNSMDASILKAEFVKAHPDVPIGDGTLRTTARVIQSALRLESEVQLQHDVEVACAQGDGMLAEAAVRALSHASDPVDERTMSAMQATLTAAALTVARTKTASEASRESRLGTARAATALLPDLAHRSRGATMDSGSSGQSRSDSPRGSIASRTLTAHARGANGSDPSVMSLSGDRVARHSPDDDLAAVHVSVSLAPTDPLPGQVPASVQTDAASLGDRVCAILFVGDFLRLFPTRARNSEERELDWLNEQRVQWNLTGDIFAQKAQVMKLLQEMPLTSDDKGRANALNLNVILRQQIELRAVDVLHYAAQPKCECVIL